jgi:hypothetical protein
MFNMMVVQLNADRSMCDVTPVALQVGTTGAAVPEVDGDICDCRDGVKTGIGTRAKRSGNRRMAAAACTGVRKTKIRSNGNGHGHNDESCASNNSNERADPPNSV